MELLRMNIAKIIKDIKYKDYTIMDKVGIDGRPYLQVDMGMTTCAGTGESTVMWGRKWYLSPHMTETEIVQTAFKAVLAAEEHEVREFFEYKGRKVFNPHFDVNDMIKLCDIGHLDGREDPNASYRP